MKGVKNTMPSDIDYRRVLTECGLEVDRAAFFALSEEAKIQVTDETLTGLMKFITDKYNSLDFKEIERSAGDIAKFKYARMLYENTDILLNIYKNSTDPGAENYVGVVRDVQTVMNHLEHNRRDYMQLYQAGNGVVQLLYTSLVAACIYSVGILISNTIRFVTTETETDCQVLFDEIPGTLKHVHIKNIRAAAGDIDSYTKLLQTYTSQRAGRSLQESVSLAAVMGSVRTAGGVVAGAARGAAAVAAANPIMTGIAVGAAVLVVLPRVLVIIREIIYSIYFYRVKISEMLGIQADLIATNIESLEAGRGPKKVIARQRRIADSLRKWQGRIAIKVDSVNSQVATQKNRENAQLRIDRNSPIGQGPSYFSSGDLML